MRGKSDEDLKAMAERGGVAGMTCIARFVREEGDLEGSTLNHYLDHVDYAFDLIGARGSWVSGTSGTCPPTPSAAGSSSSSRSAGP